MDDISIIGGDGLVNMLSGTPAILDRYRASNYFLQMHHGCEGIVQPIWFVRAALAEFKAAVETVASGLPEPHNKAIWKKSATKVALENCVLTKVLGKLRDIAFHTSQSVGDTAVFHYQMATVSEPVSSSLQTIFFSPLTSSRETNKSGITQENIEWFNRQSQCLPAYLLINEAWFLLGTKISWLSSSPSLSTATNSIQGAASKLAPPNVKR